MKNDVRFELLYMLKIYNASSESRYAKDNLAKADFDFNKHCAFMHNIQSLQRFAHGEYTGKT